jgi:uncharacterized membrane protein
MAVHSTPILIVMSPLYLIFKGPFFLLLLQVLVVGFSAVPLYRITLQELRSHTAANAIAFCYLLYHPLITGLMRDFHPEMFFPLFLFWSYYYASIKPDKFIFIVSILGALLIKEDTGIYMIFYCLWIAWKYPNMRRIAWGATVMCMVLLILTIMVVIPYFRSQINAPQIYGFLNTWHDFGNTPGQIISYAWHHPLTLFRELFPLSNIKPLPNIILPLLCLPLLSSAFYLILPPLAVAWLSRIPSMSTLGLHYGVMLIPFLFIALVRSLAHVKDWSMSRSKRVRYWCSKLTILLLVVAVLNFPWILFRPGHYHAFAEHRAVYSAIGKIPLDASVSAQAALIPHIPRRDQIAMLPRIGEAQYVLLDTEVSSWPMEKPELIALQQIIDRDQRYTILQHEGNSWLYKKR